MPLAPARQPYETQECPQCWFNLRRWLMLHDLELVEDCPCCGCDLVEF